MPRTPACSLDLPCDPNGSPLCACSLVRGRPLDAGGEGLVGSGSFAQSIESFKTTSSRSSTRSSLVDILISAGSSWARASVAADRLGRTQRAQPLCASPCLVVESARRCNAEAPGQLWHLGKMPARLPVGCGNIRWQFAPIREQFELCHAGLRCAAPCTENVRL
jgi:hypothetical protein